MSTKDDTAK